MGTSPSVLIVGAAPTAGHEAFYVACIRSAEVVIAADGGIALCRRAERVPDVCVGDFDSTSPEDLAWAEERCGRIVRFPAAKSESDLDLAVREARAMGARSVVLTAAFTGRLDHTLASLGTLLSVADLDARGLEATMTLYPLSAASRPVLVLRESPGTLFSVYGVAGPVVVSIAGARYELSSTRLDALSSHGLSNVAGQNEVVVTVEEGEVIVVVVCDSATSRS